MSLDMPRMLNFIITHEMKVLPIVKYQGSRQVGLQNQYETAEEK
jgi:hypothetical protein